MTNLESKLIGISSALKKIRRDIPKLAKLHVHIVVQGEKGTGRRLISHLIHETSGTGGALAVYSASVHTDLDLKELEKKIKSNVSTVLFQDLEDFSFLHQALICRIIKNLPRKPFVRVIVTIKGKPEKLNRDRKLTDEIVKILNHFEQVTLSPLKSRTEDIPSLAEYFIAHACNSIGASVKAININTLDYLVMNDWAGNVGELRSVVERSVLSSEGDTVELPDDLIDEQVQLEQMLLNIRARKKFSFDSMLSMVEKALIQKALDAVSYNQTKAADILNISEQNLRYRMKKFHLLPSRKRQG